MHLAVLAEVRPVGIDNRRRVVVHPLGAFLEERTHHHHAQLLGQLHEMLTGRAFRNSLGQLEVLITLLVAEIQRREKFLQTDNLRSTGGQLAHPFGITFDIPFLVGRTGHLGNSYLHFHVDYMLCFGLQRYDIFLKTTDFPPHPCQSKKNLYLCKKIQYTCITNT